MLSEVKERLEGPKYNIDFGGKGIGMSTMLKGAILWKCLNTFVPHQGLETKEIESQPRLKNLDLVRRWAPDLDLV